MAKQISAKMSAGMALWLFVAAGCSDDVVVGDGPTPTEELGAACDTDGQCISGHCVMLPDDSGSVCTVCGVPGDCDSDETCAWEQTTAQNSCVSALGTPAQNCDTDADCSSGHCFDLLGPDRVCSDCTTNDDCGAQLICLFRPVFGYAICSGTQMLGSDCNADNECISGACNPNRCAECNVDADCSGGGRCVDDTAGVGYFVCQGDYSADCTSDTDCGSGSCFTTPGGRQVCSACEVNGDCGPQQECNFRVLLGYARCEGTGPLGATCSSDDECNSGFCAASVCSECGVNADCASNVCADDTDDSGYFICQRALDDFCMRDAECVSGFCVDGPAIGMSCGECGTDSDCTPPMECTYGWLDGYTTCVGPGTLGDPCDDPAECNSGSCNGGTCSECSVNSDCGTNSCVEGIDLGFFVCADALGATCLINEQCLSSACFDRGFGASICSECASDADCGADTCRMDWAVRYAVCR